MKVEKLLVKLSLKDLQSLQKIFTDFSAGKSRFDTFKSEIIQKLKDKENWIQ